MTGFQKRFLRLTTLTSAALLSALCVGASCAYAEMGLMVRDQTPKFEELRADYSPLPQDRLRQLHAMTQEHEMRAQYGLLDYNTESAHYNDVSAQRDGVIREVMLYQADGSLKNLRKTIEVEAPHSVVARSALLLGTAYLFVNGKTFTTHLSENIDVSGNAKIAAGTHALCLTRKNISALGISSGIGYQMEPDANPTVKATLSKEVAPHVIASIGQKRSLASSSPTPTESMGEIHFGANF